jgi:hypothetical protein
MCPKGWLWTFVFGQKGPAQSLRQVQTEMHSFLYLFPEKPKKYIKNEDLIKDIYYCVIIMIIIIFIIIGQIF